jgi:hypothetical protein
VPGGGDQQLQRACRAGTLPSPGGFPLAPAPLLLSLLPVVLPIAALVVAVALIIWDVALAGRMSRIAEAPRPWATLTGIIGLILIPAVLIRALSASLLDGRTVAALGWFWPFLLTLCTVQAAATLALGIGARTVAAPILVYNTILAIAGWLEYAAGAGVGMPALLHAVPTAVANAIGYVAGSAALWSPLAIAPPLLAPAYRARWALNATVRGLVAICAVIGIVAFASELPLAVRGVRSFAQWTLVPLRERPDSQPLRLGLRLLPAVRGTPSPLSVRFDTQLADTVNVSVVAATVRPSGATPRALDSLAHVLDDYRRDSAVVIITIGWDPLEAMRVRFAPTAWARERAALVAQVIRRVRPDVLVPFEEPYGAAVRITGRLPLTRWQTWHTDAARTAKTLRPRTQVLASIGAFDARDSALTAWAMGDSVIDGVAYSMVPGIRAAVNLEARMQAADRWRIGRAPSTQQSHVEWVTLAGGYPWIHGEQAQDRAVWGTLAWASARPSIAGVVVGDPGDYDTRRGLRGPGGRLRPAVTSLSRAIRGLSATASR